ncbi:MAG: amidase family protein [Vicinamibacterales bacterium]|nr:amidase family protein [Vicinamibacterales bacterium]
MRSRQTGEAGPTHDGHIRTVPQRPQPRLRLREINGIDIESNQPAAGVDSFEQRPRVPAIAQCAVAGRLHPTVQRRLEQNLAGPENGPDSDACRVEFAYRNAVRAAVSRAMDAHGLDACVYPTWSNPPRLIGDLNTPHGDDSQFFSPTTGFPAIQVPMGYTRRVLPAGITFLGRAWSEARRIALAHTYEQATRHRRPPAITPP